jgi:IS1 family transposase
MSIRGTSRITGVARETVNKLLLDAGAACAAYLDAATRNLRPECVEADEIWAFIGSKERNIPEGHEDDPNYGSVWNWVAIDADTKLVITWLVGDRGIECCYDFLTDLRARLVPGHRFQLTTDGYGVYQPVVDSLWRGNIDYGIVIKEYGGGNEDHKYSPADCTSIEKRVLNGDPDPDRISTSYVERHNLTTRMHNRRYTRLTNAFSKRAEQHAASVALGFAYYNLCQAHGTLTKAAGRKTTPAMAAGIERAPWSVTQLAELLESN